MQSSATKSKTGCGYAFSPINSADFDAADYSSTWLVKRLLVAGQPAIVGGPRKSLKTSLLVDLAVSLGSHTPFLGCFDTYQRVSVAVLSGESGGHTLQETARRVCAARGVRLRDTDILWDFQLPQLANPEHVLELQEGLRANGAQVAIVDPLYLCLLAGQAARGLEASNLFDMGPLLMAVANACHTVGCTPIFAHHARKNRAADERYEPLDLEDLAYAGTQEFSRQWLLVSRRLPYRPGTGEHNLWLAVGGSAGQSGCWSVDVNEGVLDEDFSGRRWQVTVGSWEEAQEAAAEDREVEEQQRREKQDRDVGSQVLAALDRLVPRGETAVYSQVREAAGIGNPKMTRAVLRLTEEGVVEEAPTTVAVGEGHKGRRTARGLRRKSIGLSIGSANGDL